MKLRLVYGERPEMLLCGSSEDITTCWDEFSAEAYKGGRVFWRSLTYFIAEMSQADGIRLSRI